MKANVRAANAKDLGPLAGLCAEVQAWHAATYPAYFQPNPLEAELADYFAAKLGEDGTHIFLSEFLSEDAGSPAGYLFCRVIDRQPGLFHRARRRLLIEHVGVAAAHRRQGHATALFAAAKELAQREDCHDLSLDTWEANAAAQAFFEGQGFTQQRRLYAKAL
ncbi:MAG: N-acetyltransferase [Pseudomonadota bacterium]